MPSAAVPWTRVQRVGYGLTALSFIALLLARPDAFSFTLGVCLVAAYGLITTHKVLAVCCGLRRHETETVTEDEIRDLDRQGDWPRYSVLIPLYREAGIVGDLVRAVDRLDYPRERLDVRLLLEEDDSETRSAVERVGLPAWIRACVVPAGQPRTKSRACAWALEQVAAEFLTIFDAEDRPEPDQLKKAVAVFRRSPANVACLQARLNFYNSRENVLTRWFTLEYATWFDLYLPGLHAIGAPIPLGGTSNHFRVAALRSVGGWDPWNVTEDCDLGMRLARARSETRVLDSTTWEEAVPKIGPWLRQRSRWIKGYWQTHLVHTRRPLRTMGEMGLARFIHMNLTVAGQVFALLFNPLCWVLAVSWLIGRWELFDPLAPWTVVLLAGAVALGLFNVLFILMHAIGGCRRGFYRLVPDALTMPFYWMLMSVGAWRGIAQFATDPFTWEKTPHGISSAEDAIALDSMAYSRHRRRVVFGVMIGLAAILVIAAVLVPFWMGAPQRIREAASRHARVLLSGTCATAEATVEQAWSSGGRVAIDLAWDRSFRGEERVRGIVHLKVLDGEWYQHETRDMVATNGRVSLTVDLGRGWNGVIPGRPWGAWCLWRVRVLGVRLFFEGRTPGGVTIESVSVVPDPQPAIAARVVSAPQTVATYSCYEARIALSREYADPFDPDSGIALTGVFQGPSNVVERVPAFYGQDYRRVRSGRGESLEPAGLPYWAVRFCPRVPGVYAWHVEGKDVSGDEVETEPATFEVTPSAHRGYVRVDKSGRWFMYEDGSFCYPIGLNIRSPSDQRNRENLDFALPPEEDGLRTMERYIGQMHGAGMNFARTWLTSWWLGLEWRRDWPGFQGLGRYNLQNAWRMDALLDCARTNGVLLEFTLNYQAPFITRYDAEWWLCPYNAMNGGPLRAPEHVLTHPEAKRLFRNYYRYIGARYGWDPQVFGWTLWNEVNEVNWNPDVQREWHGKMAGVLRSFDQGRHMVSTEFIGDPGMPEVWGLPEIEYTQLSAYNRGLGLVDTFAARVADLESFGKPIVLEEYGGHAGGCIMPAIASEVHDGLWIAWTMPVASAPMAWWWNLIFEKGLDRYYSAFAKFAQGEDLRGEDWVCERLTVDGAPGLAALTRRGKSRAHGWIYSPALTELKFPFAEWRLQSGQLNREYRLRVSRRFDPLSRDPGARFANVSNGAITIRGMSAGRYRARFYDTWDPDKPVVETTVQTDGADLRVQLPPLDRDMGFKLDQVDGKGL